MGNRYVTDFSYYDGYYDGQERQFRGFAEVIETQHGDESAPTTVTRYYYDVGDQVESRKGLLRAQTVTDSDGDCQLPETGCYHKTINELATYEITEGVSFSAITQTKTILYEQTSQPVQLLERFAYDSYGNQTEAFNYGRVCTGEAGQIDFACGNDERLTYIRYALNLDDWIIRAPAVITQTDIHGNFVGKKRLFYDGWDYFGLPQGKIERGNLTRQEDNLGPEGNNRWVRTNRQAYDAFGNVVGRKDAKGNLTTIKYDPRFQTFPIVEKVHLGGGNSLSYQAAYDFGFGQIESAIDFNGHSSAFAYDVFGRLSKIAAPGDTLELPTQEFVYELGSPRSSLTTHLREHSGTADVRTSVVYFDGLGRKLQTRSEAENGQVVVAEAITFNARQGERNRFLPYFATGLAYHPPDPVMPHSRLAYDALARVVRAENTDGTFSTLFHRPLARTEYDEEDNTPDSNHFNTPKTLYFDGLERLTGVQEINRIDGVTDVYTTTYGYDLLDNLTRIKDAQGNVKIMRYDGLSRKVYMDDPDRGETNYVYDDAGNLQQTTDAKGQVITYTYDAANRPLTEQWQRSDGTFETVFTYHYDGDLSPLYPDARNTMGQVAYVEDPAGAVYFSYDARGNVAGRIRRFHKEELTFVTRMAYDAMDRLTELTYPDGYTVTYTYNDQGSLEHIPGFVDDINYNASAQRAAITYTNGVSTSYGYDLRLRLEHLHTASGPTVLQDLTYTFDQVSNILGMVDARPSRTAVNDQTQTFIYDNLYRLTHATGTYGQIDYDYDSIGNLIRQSSTVTDERLDLGEMRYGENGAGPHALTSVASDTYRYDANGNQLGTANSTYTWNARDWLVAVADEASTSTYAYDADGQRLRQTVSRSGVMTTTLYPGQYAELRGDQFIRYIFDNQQRIAQITTDFDPSRLLRGFSDTITTTLTTTNPTEILWYVADHLGGTNLMVNGAGQVVSELAYYPYGLTRYELNNGEAHYQFMGKELDESGLYYYGARYYDARTARFISVDPLYAEEPERGIQNPQFLHLYAYSLNNPVRYIDPNGLAVWDSVKGFVGSNIDVIQTGLDIVGMVPVIGEAADLLNAGIYAARGDYVNAALSAAAAVPLIGNVATGGKLAAKAGKAFAALGKTEKLAEIGGSVMRFASKVCSFSSDTEVATLEGLQAIDQIQIGDLVLAYDENLGRTGFYTVTATFAHLDPLIIILSVDGEEIETTPEHPFFTAAGQWISAGQLRVGDRIHQADGRTGAVEQIEVAHRSQIMYNLTVANAHTFFVGDGRWLVHNTCKIPLPKQIHHFATNKSKVYTPALKKIAEKFGLELEGEWNKELLAHLGRHPNEYHEFVQQGMSRAAREARKSTEKFLELFEKYVKEPIRNNPELLRKAGWE